MDEVNVLVAFYSRHGATERLAVLIAEGALQGGARIRLRRARDLAPEETIASDPGWKKNRDRMHQEYAAPAAADAEWADALILGSPSGGGSPELEGYLALLDGLEAGNGTARNRIGAAFSSSFRADEATESTLDSLHRELTRLGVTIVSPAPGAGDDFAEARRLGYRVAEMAREQRGLH